MSSWLRPDPTAMAKGPKSTRGRAKDSKPRTRRSNVQKKAAEAKVTRGESRGRELINIVFHRNDAEIVEEQAPQGPTTTGPIEFDPSTDDFTRIEDDDSDDDNSGEADWKRGRKHDKDSTRVMRQYLYHVQDQLRYECLLRHPKRRRMRIVKQRV